MNIIRKLINAATGKRPDINALQIVFHEAALQHGAHGLLVASHKDKKIVERPIRFVFLGLSVPPVLTPEIMNHIWKEAMIEGFIPHSLRTYGLVLQTHGAVPYAPVNGLGPRSGGSMNVPYADPLPAKTRAIAKADMAASLSAGHEHTLVSPLSVQEHYGAPFYDHVRNNAAGPNSADEQAISTS